MKSLLFLLFVSIYTYANAKPLFAERLKEECILKNFQSNDINIHQKASINGKFSKATSSNKDCRWTGYETDNRGCPNYFKCKTSGLFEGDIMVNQKNINQLKQAYGRLESTNARGAAIGIQLWNETQVGTRYKIPYLISPSMSTSGITAIQAAIADFSANTGIDFEPRSNETDYIIFLQEVGCWSYVGRQGLEQEISIGPGCETKGIVEHEIMHALGFWHEQSRPDRDCYVVIQTGNISPGKELNFYKRRGVDSLGSSYDFTSVMHYDGYAFSDNGLPTILNKATRLPVVANRDEFSSEDLVQINILYPHTATTTETISSGVSVQLQQSNFFIFILSLILGIVLTSGQLT